MLRFFRALSAAALSTLLLICGPAAAQDAPLRLPDSLGPAPAASDAPAIKTDPAADEAFQPLQRDFQNLFTSLRNKGAITEEDNPVISAMRDRAAQFSQQFPDDPRGLAMQLQASIWLKDDDLVAELYERVLRTAIVDDARIRLSWANLLKSQNRYERMLEVLQQVEFDPVKTPDAYLALSEALFAEQRFQEALDALGAIPLSVLDENMFVKFRSDEALKAREPYPALWEEEQSLRTKEDAADDLPRALLVTDRGTIMLELFEDHAPNTVANFIDLIEQGFYNGTTFHRVEPNFMAQGGDPNSKEGATGIPGQGGPGYRIKDEIDRPDHRKHFTGSLAMGKTAAPDSAGCQFYITHLPTPHLNGKHTVFGRVLEGLDIARAIERGEAIRSITMIRKRDHDYKPEVLPALGTAVPVPPPALGSVPSSLPRPAPPTIPQPAATPAGETPQQPAPNEPPTKPDEPQPDEPKPDAPKPDAPKPDGEV